MSTIIRTLQQKDLETFAELVANAYRGSKEKNLAWIKNLNREEALVLLENGKLVSGLMIKNYSFSTTSW
jgi:hypothetical protein